MVIEIGSVSGFQRYLLACSFVLGCRGGLSGLVNGMGG